jgi:hypothetical protein
MVERVPVVLGGGIGDRDGEGGQQCALFPLHPGGTKEESSHVYFTQADVRPEVPCALLSDSLRHNGE